MKRYPLGVIMLSAAEVEGLLGVKRPTLRQWVSRGRVIKPGRDVYDMGSLMNYLGERGELPSALQRP